MFRKDRGSREREGGKRTVILGNLSLLIETICSLVRKCLKPSVSAKERVFLSSRPPVSLCEFSPRAGSSVYEL